VSEVAGRRAYVSFDVGDIRIAGAVMLAAAALLSALPHHPVLPCPMHLLTGVPCPLCGMTTSVEATLHGRIGTALHANPAGIVAVALAILVLVRPPRRLYIPRSVIVVAIASMWIFELWRFALV
jgi:Protein of unknown function (DUF2752)